MSTSPVRKPGGPTPPPTPTPTPARLRLIRQAAASRKERPSRPITFPSGMFEVVAATGEIRDQLGGPREPRGKVLLVSDNSFTLNAFHIYFEEEDYSLVLCDAEKNGFAACFEEFDSQNPDLVIIDVDKIEHKEDALSAAEKIREKSPLTALIIMFKEKDVDIDMIQCQPDLLFFGHPDLSVLNIQIGHALTERSRKLAQQRARVRELKELEREKRSFMQVAHDLKGQMMALVNSLELVKCALGGLQESDKNKLSIIVGSLQGDIDSATEAANNIVKQAVKALRSQGRDGQDGMFSPNEVIQEAIDTVKKDLAGKRLRLECSLDDSLQFMYGPKSIFLSAVYNLLMNALQATPEGGEISVSSKKTDEKTIELKVEDTGAGILKEKLPEIWKEAYTSRADEGGTGFGMSIIKECSDLMGGKIQVRSKVNRGTSFTVTLPLYKRRGTG